MNLYTALDGMKVHEICSAFTYYFIRNKKERNNL